ncbi:MAG: hypothetical protein L6305_07960, partial [Actinomycetia bacterium]|nr:hypothetical protein [Actinomycetes bacterium]
KIILYLLIIKQVKAYKNRLYLLLTGILRISQILNLLQYSDNDDVIFINVIQHRQVLTDKLIYIILILLYFNRYYPHHFVDLAYEPSYKLIKILKIFI